MNLKNSLICNVIADYISKYKTQIEKIYLVLKKQDIEFCCGCMLPTTEVMASLPKGVQGSPIDTIFVNTNYNNDTNGLCNVFSEYELHAIISHEIGHIAAYYENKSSGDIEEEKLADQCAVVLGLENELKTALEKMKIPYKEESKKPFTDTDRKNKLKAIIDDIDLRIDELNKTRIKNP